MEQKVDAYPWDKGLSCAPVAAITRSGWAIPKGTLGALPYWQSLPFE